MKWKISHSCLKPPSSYSTLFRSIRDHEHMICPKIVGYPWPWKLGKSMIQQEIVGKKNICSNKHTDMLFKHRYHRVRWVAQTFLVHGVFWAYPLEQMDIWQIYLHRATRHCTCLFRLGVSSVSQTWSCELWHFAITSSIAPVTRQELSSWKWMENPSFHPVIGDGLGSPHFTSFHILRYPLVICYIAIENGHL